MKIGNYRESHLDRGPDYSDAVSASILDARFHAPLTIDLEQKPQLATTIDAEESFDWSKPFSRSSHDVSSIARQHVAHRLFEAYGVLPIYLVTYPVAAQPEGFGPLVDYLRSGKCEIGAQLHPWVTPPFEEVISVENSFPGNLPRELEFRKLQMLAEQIESTTSVRPVVYRAGRYGVGPHTAEHLKRLKFLLDTSVVPCQSFAEFGGPDFFRRSPNPYWVDPERTLLELPITSSLVGALAPSMHKFVGPLFAKQGFSPLRSVLARTGVIERIRLTPEGNDIGDAKRLVRSLIKSGTRMFTLTYHSTSLVPGAAPYVASQRDLDRFLDWLDAFYDFFLGEIGGQPTTPAEFYHRHRAAADR